jgi:hypothetical protein
VVVGGAERWRENWRVIAPPGAVRVEVGRSRRARRRRARELAALPAGTPVVLAARGPATVRRLRAFAEAAGLATDRAFLALPSATAPAYLVEDAPAPVGVLLRTAMTTPPDARLGALFDAAFAVVRALRPWRLVRLLAPGRLVVARRA